MHVTLDNDNLIDYFPLIMETVPDARKITGRQEMFNNANCFNPYYFQNRNSDTLVVTLGDSWTWACDVVGYNDILEYRSEDWKIVNGVLSNVNSERSNRSYGNILSQELNGDWLNLGIPGSSNIRIAQLSSRLADIIPKLHYSKILIVITLTEAGRHFNSEFDTDIDHYGMMQQLSHPNQLLEKLNHWAIDQIQTCLNDFSHVQLLVGTNFVDAIGLDLLTDNQQLTTPWYQLLDIVYDKPTYICGDYALFNFVRSLEDRLIPTELHPMFKTWISNSIDCGQLAIQKLQQSPYISKGERVSCHPLAPAHRIWAEYILKHVC